MSTDNTQTVKAKNENLLSARTYACENPRRKRENCACSEKGFPVFAKKRERAISQPTRAGTDMGWWHRKTRNVQDRESDRQNNLHKNHTKSPSSLYKTQSNHHFNAKKADTSARILRECVPLERSSCATQPIGISLARRKGHRSSPDGTSRHCTRHTTERYLDSNK